MRKHDIPVCKAVEIGGMEQLPERAWGNAYTLLKGHRFWGTLETMKIWNATARRGVDGPFVEIRRGRIAFISLADKTEFKFYAWWF